MRRHAWVPIVLVAAFAVIGSCKGDDASDDDDDDSGGGGGEAGEGGKGDGGDGGGAGENGAGGEAGVGDTGGTAGNTGGMAGTTAMTGGAGGMGGAAGMGGTGGCNAVFNGDCSTWSFEFDVHNFVELSRGGTRYAAVVHDPVWVQDKVKVGKGAIKYTIETLGAAAPDAGAPDGGSGDAGAPQNDIQRLVGVTYPRIGPTLPGKTVSGWLWVPAGHKFSTVELFVNGNSDIPGVGMGGGWTSVIKMGPDLVTNEWNQFELVIPDTWIGKTLGAIELGFRFITTGAWKGDVWIDSVNKPVK